ncbi:MAG: hypothetical protein WD333_02095 [Dehalococcoidia bacterium]
MMKVRSWTAFGRGFVRGLVRPRPSAAPEPDLGQLTGAHAQKFIDDDSGYLDWIRRHPTGFVINCHRTPRPDYLMLHRATCMSIAGPGKNYTSGEYGKVCAVTKEELNAWADAHLGTTPKTCQVCQP